MKTEKIKVLMIVEQCNPTFPSVPFVAYNLFKEVDKLVDVTLVTHERNRQAFETKTNHKKVVYISQGDLNTAYYKFVEGFATKGRINWPLYHTLTYPIYGEFNNKVYKQFKPEILRGDYDVVHALTPMMPRYPYKVVKACRKTPFLLGPVNGGLPFPTGFQETAKQESANLNFLRTLGRSLIPGYVETYKKADKILVGSTYTLQMLNKLFALSDNKTELFYENGIASDFLNNAKNTSNGSKVNLLFVGRLVPYKCADIVIEAISKLDQEVQDKISLTIVGDGSERGNLEQQVRDNNLSEVVRFAGWVNQQETLEYYSKSDIFCFPSIREFGGAVVLEAMACGLPCIVANNGGIAEYVTEETGFKIDPISKEYLAQELTEKIKLLVKDEQLRKNMSLKAVERVQEFEWSQKAKKIVEVYQELIKAKS
ncbi:glycosyltransferase family 4 protein [Allocoleopsis sp.]|uniref:glycosyltransferase family 4 protein n=1 Tax=Allocoleopsis sp. TaxID=3088169 RepID=UPI002FD2112B